MRVKMQQISKDILSNQTLQDVKRFKTLFVLIHLNEDVNAKRYEAKRFYLPKCIIKNYNVIIKKNNFYDKPTDSDVKRYEQIKS